MYTAAYISVVIFRKRYFSIYNLIHCVIIRRQTIRWQNNVIFLHFIKKDVMIEFKVYKRKSEIKLSSKIRLCT